MVCTHIILAHAHILKALRPQHITTLNGNYIVEIVCYFDLSKDPSYNHTNILNQVTNHTNLFD